MVMRYWQFALSRFCRELKFKMQKNEHKEIKIVLLGDSGSFWMYSTKTGKGVGKSSIVM